MKVNPSMLPMLLAAVILALAIKGEGYACSDSTLSGTYLYRLSGLTYKGNAAINTTAATVGFTAVGLMRLNGLGGGSGAESVSNAGVLSNRSFTPSYQVNPDCTATINLSSCPLEHCAGQVQSLPNLLVANDGSQANFLNTVPDTSILGEIWQVPDGGCSPESVVGTYRFMTQGSGMNGHGNAMTTASSVAFGSSGFLRLNSDGTLVANDIAAFGGLILPRKQESSWFIRSDCSGGFIASPLANGTDIYVAPGGGQFVLLNAFSGTIVSGVYRKQ